MGEMVGSRERKELFLSVGWWGLEDFLESTIVVTSVLGENQHEPNIFMNLAYSRWIFVFKGWTYQTIKSCFKAFQTDWGKKWHSMYQFFYPASVPQWNTLLSSSRLSSSVKAQYHWTLRWSNYIKNMSCIWGLQENYCLQYLFLSHAALYE